MYSSSATRFPVSVLSRLPLRWYEEARRAFATPIDKLKCQESSMVETVVPGDDEPFVSPGASPQDPPLDLPGDSPRGVPTDAPVPVPSDVPFNPPGDVPATDDRDGVPMERPPVEPTEQPAAPLTVV